MPGFMFDFITAGKRAAMARQAAAGSEVAYREYVAAVIAAGTEVRRDWVELSYSDEVLALHREMAATVEQSLEIAQAEYATGGGMGTLEAQTRFLDQAAKHHSDIATHTDHLAAARARFKAALGLEREKADPPWPARSFPSAPLADDETLWREVCAAQPGTGFDAGDGRNGGGTDRGGPPGHAHLTTRADSRSM
jgi:cobalt-zinc-cadmium efflux system outer membrane protein